MESIGVNMESLFEEHIGLINRTIRKNRTLLFALRLEDENVFQQLAITMMSAIRRFDSDRSASLAAYLYCSLQYEILNIKRRHKPHGITGIPKGDRVDFLYLDNTMPEVFELSMDDDMSVLEFSELFESLTEPETEALELKIRGYPVSRKAHTSALDGVRCKYAEIYAT